MESMEGQKKRFGDRKDGRRLRTLHPMDSMSPYIMVERNDASNLITDRFDIQAADRYVRAKREAGLASFGLMHLVIAAYVRSVSQRPGINRFIGGQKVYARDRIVVNMVVKRTMELNEQSTVIKVVFDPRDTASDVYRKFNETYESALSRVQTGFDSTARIINYIPGLLKKFAVWLLKFLDYFDLLPRALTDVSPFHASMFITSMGSLGIPPIHHHLYNFGNVPVFISFGSKYHEYRLNSEGVAVKRKYIDISVVTDERVCDGFYFASALRLIRGYFTDPSVLDSPPETVVADID
jgi:hypothetical protein